MARHRKTGVERPRGKRRGAPGPAPLLVIAGLPQATARAAAGTINNDPRARWHAVASPFPRDDREIYRHADAIADLGRQACEFAREGNRDREGIPAPSRIAVAYVLEDGFEELWTVFGHAVWPIPLVHPDRDPAMGRHWRHEIEVVNQVLQRALAALEAGPAEALRLRLEAHRTDEVLLLPGRNFHLEGGERLVERFRAFMSGALEVHDIAAGIRIERFAFDRLEAFYRRCGGNRKKFAVDERDLVFAKSHHGQHGAHHRLAGAADLTPAIVQRTLEARYRFGTPLVPDGFQHDAQREGSRLRRERFDCVVKGRIPISGSHANVYPSDVVTGDIEE